MASSQFPCPASLDSAFGPQVNHCRRAFDFTQLFEECFMNILPSVLLLGLAPIRTYFLAGERRKIGGSSFQILKLIVICCFASTQLALLLLWCLIPTGRTPATIASAAVSFVDSLVIGILSYQEHTNAIRPSALLEVYLFFTLLFDAVRTRTLWLVSGDQIAIIFTTSVGLKLTILLLEARQKTSYLASHEMRRGPEETSGAFGRVLFLWLLGLIRTGYRKILVLEDLYPLDRDLRSETLGARFQNAWFRLASRNSKEILISALIKTLKWPLLAPVLPRMLLIAFTYCQPFLINRVLDFNTAPTNENSKNIGYGLIGAYALVYSGISLSTPWYWFHIYRFTTMIRGAIVTKVYTKVNETSITDFDDSAALTLMSTDVERVTNGLNVVHEVWANVIEVAIGLYLLQLQIGLTALTALAVALATAIAAAMLASTAGTRQKSWLEAIERRISATATMLSNMKGIKMSGLTQILSKVIQNMRVEEIKSASRFRTFQICLITLAYVPLTISPLLTFTAYTIVAEGSGGTLDVSTLFTSLSILTLLATQFTQLFQSIPAMVAAFASLRRIQTFLLSESRVDGRMRSSILPQVSVTDFSLAKMVTELLDCPEPEFRKKLKELAMTPERLDETGEAISIVDASFAWKRSGPPLLRHINISVKFSHLTVIVGPVPCGKSTLLKAILGEVHNLAGSVCVASRDISFCDQTPWLRNTTVQQNILGFANFDSRWYSAVLRACALDSDLSQFPDGDQTLIGSNGITLSGGQKQRVAIARAVYAAKKIAIFDDVLSGLDSSTMLQVFNGVFGSEGLLRQRKTTIVLATHAVHLLPFADHIVALGLDGEIMEQGSFEKLSSLDGYVRSLSIIPTDAVSPTTEVGSESTPSTLGHSLETPLDCNMATSSRQLGEISVYWYYFKATGLFSTVIFLIAELTFTTLEYFPSIWLSFWANANAAQPNQKVGLYLGVYAALQVSCLISLFFGARHVANTMVVKSGKQLHLILLATVMAAPMAFFNKTDTGITTNRFSQDMQLIDAELPIALLLLGASAFGAVAQAILVLVASHYIGTIFVAVIVAFYFVQRYYLRTSRQLRFLDLEAKSPLYSLFIETLKGRATIRAFNWQEDFRSLNIKFLDSSQQPLYLLYSVQQWLTLVLGLISAALAVILVTLIVELRDTTNPALGGVALVTMISLSSNLMSVVIIWTKLETSIGAVARVKQFAESTPSEDFPMKFDPPAADWPANGEIEFRDISASYKVDSELALTNVSLSIKAGEKIAICGRSGSGKSTLISTLFRLLDPSSGSIVVDNVDISSIPPQYVRSRLNGLPQEPYFMHGNVRLNVDPLGCASDEMIIAALSKVKLWDTVREKGGLGSRMNADFLSHGQRQLFCLARAILRRSTIVVLDEATSSVDTETDTLMQHIIREEFGTQTLIVVAHRLNTILDFDRIALFDEGVLIEYDTPTALLSRASAFRDLCDVFSWREENTEESMIGQTGESDYESASLW